MSDDHLSNEVSISAELTERGVKAGAKSRTLAAVDRLLGGVVDLANVPIERIAQTGRAKTDTQVAAIKALGEKQLEAIHADPDFAARAMQQHLRVLGTRHENKIEAVRAALEDLRETPPTEEQNNSGGEQLDDAFLNRWERYAEDATSDQLREKWGRVLAGEVRAPGTFSGKALRIVDELDASTAATFERLCASRLGDAIVRGVAGKLSYSEGMALVAANLIMEPSLGQVRLSTTGSGGDGTPLIFFLFADGAVAIRADASQPNFGHDNDAAIVTHEQGASIPIYALTDAGNAIASILPTDTQQVLRDLATAISKQVNDFEVRAYRKVSEGNFVWEAVATNGTLVLR